jgi:hypothetical protein
MQRRRTKKQERATAGTGYRVEPHDSRAFALYDERNNELVGIFVYLRGAAYVARRFAELERALAAAAKMAAADFAPVTPRAGGQTGRRGRG